MAAIVPILAIYRIDTPERSPHPVAVRLLDDFGERDNVLHAVVRNMYDFTWWGSVTNSHAKPYQVRQIRRVILKHELEETS